MHRTADHICISKWIDVRKHRADKRVQATVYARLSNTVIHVQY